MKLSLEGLFEHFIYEAEFVKKLRPATLKGYQLTYTTFIKLLPGITLAEITHEKMTEFFKILQERKRLASTGIVKTGIKNSTAASYWCKLNAFFSWLTQKGYLHESPFKTLSYPTPSYEDRKFLKKEDIERILTAIHSSQTTNIFLFKRNLVIFFLFLYCGLRKEELLLLQIRDIDFERMLITIRGEASKSKRTRQIPMHKTTAMYLLDYLKERKSYTTPQLIVSSQHDSALSEDGLKHLVKKLQETSKVYFHLHQFRHTFAVNFLKETNNIFKLKMILGHRDIRVTLLYLRCLPPDELQDDIQRMTIERFI